MKMSVPSHTKRLSPAPTAMPDIGNIAYELYLVYMFLNALSTVRQVMAARSGQLVYVQPVSQGTPPLPPMLSRTTCPILEASRCSCSWPAAAAMRFPTVHDGSTATLQRSRPISGYADSFPDETAKASCCS
ncbi:hypothetical protein Bca4012_101382 [Brassica carinata]